MHSLIGMQKLLEDKMTPKIASLKETLRHANKKKKSLVKLWPSEQIKLT